MDTVSDMTKDLRQVLQTIPMLIPTEANNNLRDFLFGEWEEPCPFCTKTYPEIIRRLKKVVPSSSIGDFLAGKITDSNGITTVALHQTDRPTFGGFDDMPHENLIVRLITPGDVYPEHEAWQVTISGAVNLEIAEIVAGHGYYQLTWTIGPNGNTHSIYPRVRKFVLENMSTLQTIKLAIPYISLTSNAIGTAITSVSNCENLRLCEITSLGEHGNIPSFTNVKRGFTLDLRPIGVTKDEFYNPERRPWERFGPGWWNGCFGLQKAMGLILCTDGEIDFL